jgi:hypothetical protein
MNPQTTQETLDLLKTAMSKADEGLAKAWTQSASAISGITAYDLEGPAKKLYPVITPLRNSIPRVSGKGGIQANWRAVTGVNTGNTSPYVSGGNRGGVIATSTADYLAAYKGLGLEDYVTFEADYAAEGFDDVKALAVEGLLRAMMIAEEVVILGGNTSVTLSTAATPTLSTANTGGTLVNAANYGVGVVALTFEGYRNASLTNGVPQTVTRVNAGSDGNETINGGMSNFSAQANIAVAAGSGNLGSISATVTAIAGAYGYAWYWGANTGNLTLGAITTINSVVITAAATGNASKPGGNFQGLAQADYSKNSLAFDGLLTFAAQSSLGAYVKLMATGNAGAGTPLTSDGAGGIKEIDAALQSFWDNYRLSPDTMWVNSQEMQNIGLKILNGSSTSAQRFVFQTDQKAVGGGIMVRAYLNKFGMNGAQELQVMLHPNMPPGTILFTTNRLPYPLSNVTNVMQMRMRREYYQIEWPQVSRKYQYGIYEDGVLQHYFPPSLGIISNIGNG